MDIIREFNKKYKEEILPSFLPYEVYRLRQLKKYKIFNVLGIVLILVLFLIITFPPLQTLLFKHAIFVYMAMIGSPTTGVLLLWYTSKIKKNYARTLKKNCLPILTQLFDNLRHSLGTKILSDEEVIAAGFYDCKYAFRTVDDEFIGEYRGVEFKISEDELSTRGKNPDICRFLNINFRNIDSLNEFSLQNSQIAKARVFKKKRTIIFTTTLILIIGLSILLGSEEFSKQRGILVFLLVVFALINVVADTNFYSMFEKKSKFTFCKSEINEDIGNFFKNRNIKDCGALDILHSIIPDCRVRTSFYDDSFMVNYQIVRNQDLFEIGNINTSINNSAFCRNFVQKIALVYKFIDYVKDGKTNE